MTYMFTGVIGSLPNSCSPQPAVSLSPFKLQTFALDLQILRQLENTEWKSENKNMKWKSGNNA